MKKIRTLFVLVLSCLVLCTPVQSAVSIGVTFDGVLLHNEGWVSLTYGYINMTEEGERFLYHPPALINQTPRGTYELRVVLSEVHRLIVIIKNLQDRSQVYLTDPWPQGGNAIIADELITDVSLSGPAGWYRLHVWVASDSVFTEDFYLMEEQPPQARSMEPVKDFFIAFRDMFGGVSE